MIKKANLSEISKKFIGAPYKLGGRAKEEGYDCLSMVRCFYKEFGVELPSRWKRINEGNYIEFYKQHEQNGKWKKLYLAYLSNIGYKIDKYYIRPYDLLILDMFGLIVPAIVVGNGNAMVMMKKGIEVHQLKALNIIEVRRCLG